MEPFQVASAVELIKSVALGLRNSRAGNMQRPSIPTEEFQAMFSRSNLKVPLGDALRIADARGTGRS
jgi:hypothetical protein